MNQELNAPLISILRRSKNYCIDKNYSPQVSRRQSVRIRQQSLIQSYEEQINPINRSQELQWQKSDVIQLEISESPQRHQNQKQKQSRQIGWFGTSQENVSKHRLNNIFFNLQPKVQKLLYITNFILNTAIRIMFINLLVFLGIINRWIYLEVFLSLYLAAHIIYFTVMIKVLFTKQDVTSVKCQKMFYQIDWSDIEMQRLMGSHFNFGKIVSKISVFFNPFTKFQKNIKISFLRQELFKRMELVLVFIPFTLTFFIKQSDFVSQDRPNFNVYITGAICLESFRTAVTYLCVYIYH